MTRYRAPDDADDGGGPGYGCPAPDGPRPPRGCLALFGDLLKMLRGRPDGGSRGDGRG
jgi:hypothetical protein